MTDSSSTCNFGEHLMIDGYGGDVEKLRSKKTILSCLEKLPEMIGMKKIADPQIYSAPDNEIKDPGGWSGFVVIAESHISIHTFPARKFVSIDIYSCKNGMNVDLILTYFKEEFDLQEIERNFVKRGTRYPKFNITKNTREIK